MPKPEGESPEISRAAEDPHVTQRIFSSTRLAETWGKIVRASRESSRADHRWPTDLVTTRHRMPADRRIKIDRFPVEAGCRFAGIPPTAPK